MGCTETGEAKKKAIKKRDRDQRDMNKIVEVPTDPLAKPKQLAMSKEKWGEGKK